MTDLQEKILELLKEIDSLCRKNDIEFYLAAGTALGAIRHKGFLPWDDDADIYMTAKNWKKFYGLKDTLPPDRTIVSVEENFDAGYTINRYVDLSTTRLFRYLCASPQPAGMIVDIIVLDEIPGREECIKDYTISLTEYANILCKATSHTHRCPYKTNYTYYLEREQEIGRDAVLRELRDKMLKYEGEPGDVYIQRDPTVPHVWKKEIFGKPQYVPFENTMMPVAQHPYDHLCGAFDEDWLNVPEGSGRVEHVKGVNLRISNNNPYSDYEKLVNAEEIHKLYEERQRIDNLQGEYRTDEQWKRLKISDIRVKIIYKNRGIDSELLLRKIESEDFEFLDDYFKEYKDIQCHKNFIGNVTIGGWLRSKDPYYIDLGDDFLYVFLRYLMHYGLLNKSVRVLNARKNYSALSEKIIDVEKLINDIKRSCSMIEEKRYEEANILTSELYNEFPENKYLMDIYYASAYMSGVLNSSKIKSELEKLSERDDVLNTIYADILWGEDSKEAALRVYKTVIDQTHNGLIMQSIKNRVNNDSALYRELQIKLGEIDPEKEVQI